MNIRRLAIMLCFSALCWIVSIICYWEEVGFFSGFVYGLILLIVLIVFHLFVIIFELISNRVIALRNGPAEYYDTIITSHSYHQKSYIDIDIGTYSSTATYHPGSYDTWITRDEIYKSGYAKYRYKRDAFLSGLLPDKNKSFEKIYDRDKLLSRFGLTFWGMAPIWRSLTFFIPFLVNYIIHERTKVGLAGTDSITSIIYIMHISIFVASLFLKQFSEEDVKTDDREHRPLHMQILGLFTDYIMVKLMYNLIIKHNLIDKVIDIQTYEYFFINDFHINYSVFQFSIPYFIRDLIVISLVELAIYSVIIGIRILLAEKHDI